MPQQHIRWKELKSRQRRGITVMTIVQVALLLAALIDLRRRPAAEINGSKRLWTAVVFVNFIGPIAYFIFGHKRQTA